MIYLALDNDAEGEAAAEEIANRLGRHRCRRVILPRKDLNECRQAGISAEEIRRCFETARSLDPPELLRAGSFADTVVNLFWPTDGQEPGYRLPWRKAGDRVVFRSGELTLWTGATGMGKTRIVQKFLRDNRARFDKKLGRTRLRSFPCRCRPSPTSGTSTKKF